LLKNNISEYRGPISIIKYINQMPKWTCKTTK